MPCKGICTRYKALKPAGSGRYRNGQVRCQPCAIFMAWDGLFCPCCGTRLRKKPRNVKYKFLFQGIRTDSTLKAVYDGIGEDPKLKLSINQEYLKMVPRVTMEKYNEMKNSISQDGQHEPISVNPNGTVLDGHTRYSICSELGNSIKYIVKHFEKIEDEIRYVRTSNVERRQMTPYQQIEMRQDMRKIYQNEAEENKSEYISKLRRGEINPIPLKERLAQSTGYRLAQLLDIGTTSVDKANYVVDHGTEEEKHWARSGEKSLQEVYEKVVNRRHADPSTVKRSDRVFPKCKKCGGDTRFKGKCHVHEHYCCRKCSWGN